MKRKICAVAMLMTAIAVLFLMPSGDEAIDVHKETQSEQGAATVLSDKTQESGETVLDSEKPADTTTTKTTPVESETKKTSATTEKTAQTVTTTIITQTKKPETTTKNTEEKKTITTTKTQNKKPQTAPQGTTPVENHGQLSVKGSKIVDKNGEVFQLRGLSTHGVGWFPDAVSKNNFKVLRDDWGCNAIRLAMYIEESWGGSEQCYLADKERNMQLVKNGIDYATELGLYVIVDWHVLNPGNPSTHTEDAKEFFAQIAKEYNDYPNIIYEVCNEPNGGVDWSGTIKPYCEAVIKEIRKYDSDAIVVCGTATWSQDIHDVVGKTISDKNVVYALHFYANTHTDWLRDRLKSCVSSGVPILVTEFGTCDASGNSGFNAEQTKIWLETLDDLQIGFFNWSLCNKAETASVMKSDESLGELRAGTAQLTESGKLIREELRKRAGIG